MTFSTTTTTLTTDLNTSTFTLSHSSIPGSADLVHVTMTNINGCGSYSNYVTVDQAAQMWNRQIELGAEGEKMATKPETAFQTALRASLAA